MSKKRTNSLSSKWKLGKELEDYKQHKQNKKSLGYAEDEELVKRNRTKGKYPCKKLKGEHNFVVTETKEGQWFHNYCEYSVCSGCGKQKLNYSKKPSL